MRHKASIGYKEIKCLSLFTAGSALLVLGLQHYSAADPVTFDATEIQRGVCQLLALQEGSFGAMIMVVAGIGAIISSAFGAYRAATSMLVVALGSFILRALVALFFGSDVVSPTQCATLMTSTSNNSVNVPITVPPVNNQNGSP